MLTQFIIKTKTRTNWVNISSKVNVLISNGKFSIEGQYSTE